MKKKICALLLLVMAATTVPAFAADGGDGTYCRRDGSGCYTDSGRDNGSEYCGDYGRGRGCR